MKKRMFITTIVMMLVLAVALTTSSLAWFSSANATVTANAATFTASTAGSDNINLKIGDEPSGWGNNIQLSNGGRTLTPLIPTAAIISGSSVGADIVADGVSHKNGVGETITDTVTHKGYMWPATIDFNGAKINGSSSKFVIDDGENAVSNYYIGATTTAGTVGRDASIGFYYDYFYILNADQQNTLKQLTFKVDASLSNIASGQTGYQEGDYTARGYIAFIVFDEVTYVVGDTVVASAQSEYAGKKLLVYGSSVSEGEVALPENVNKVSVWVPFAAFTFCTKKGTTDTFKETAFQFADLDSKDGGNYIYNDELTTSLKTQRYDALTGNGSTDGFKLNNTTLRALNNKILTAGKTGNDAYLNGSVDSTIYSRTDAAADVDSASEFEMKPGEIFKVDMYYWLDGSSLIELTDTTVSSIGVSITASKTAD